MAPEHPTSPPRGLTPQFLQALRRPEKPYDLVDARTPGLKLRVLPSGRKVFRWSYWRGSAPARRQTTLTLGPWALEEEPGHLTLAQARDRLERLKRAHESDCLDATADALRARPGAGKTTKELAEEWYTRAIKSTRRRPERVRATRSEAPSNE